MEVIIKSVNRHEKRSGAVIVWVLLALAVGLIAGIFWGKGGWGPGGGGTGPDGGGTTNTTTADLRVTGTGVEWQGKIIPFAELAASAETIKDAAGEKPVRVVFAKDVDHLDEETVRTVLRNTDLQVVEINE